MSKLSAFNFITINGFICGPDGDISWHRHGKEENQYAVDSLRSGNILLFGRKTYEMMATYWPSPMAMENDPVVAELMNNADKIVFSKTIKQADWKNTKIIGKEIVNEMKRLKQDSERDFTILGSGTILSVFSNHELIDEYQIMIDPVGIVSGTPLFNNIEKSLHLKLEDVQTFSSGTVLLTYTKQNLT